MIIYAKVFDPLYMFLEFYFVFNFKDYSMLILDTVRVRVYYVGMFNDDQWRHLYIYNSVRIEII